MLVPEQNSFDAEKNLLNLLSEKSFHKIEVLSFTRLCDFVFRKVGQKNKKKIDDGGRNMFMSMAIESVKSELNLYKKNSNNIELVELMTGALKEFKRSGLNDAILSDTFSKLEEGTLKEKVRETKLILNKYTQLLSDKFSDPLDDLDILENSLSENDIFSGYTIFLDEFNGFTSQQLNVLKHIISQSKDVYITFSSDENVKSNIVNMELFSSVHKTIKSVTEIANECGIKNINTIKLECCKRFKNENLKKIEKNVFRSNKEKFLDEPSSIVIFNACNVYEECDFVAREIKRNIMDFGYRYKDFAVIGRNACDYSEIIENVFKKYKIKYFFDEPESISSKGLMSLALSAFDVIHSNYGANEVFRYLKTGLVGFTTDEISIIENYVLLWDIKGEKWKEDFTFNPEGFGAEEDDESLEKLELINDIRGKVFEPLTNFAKRIKKSTGKSIAKALYLLLEEVNVGENIRKFCEELKEEGKLPEAEEQSRLWDILMESINQTAVVLGDDKITSKRYMELLQVVIDSGDISFIPRGLDEVIIGSVDKIRVSEPKVVFLVGAVEGEFPRTPVQAGIFSDVERKKLISMGLNLYETLDEISLHERFLAYFALTRPSEKLYVSWASSNMNGTDKLPSEIIKEIKRVYPNCKIQDKYNINFLENFWAEKPSFEICARNWNSESEIISTVKSYFENNSEYQKQIEAIDRVIKNEPLNFKEPQNAKDLFGEKIRVSASQIEKYYSCKFFYFCKYGLKAKERKPAKFNALEYGSLIHFILEYVFSNYKMEYLFETKDSDIKKIINDCMQKYVCDKLGGLENKPSRFKYLYLRCSQAASVLVRRIINEFKQSSFVPCGYEAEISKYGDIRPLKIKLSDGSLVEVEGKVDRIDVMNLNERNYIRVVDYKTGKKDFKLIDVLYGLNMQMIVYMTAINNNGYKNYKNIVPAGVLYMPAIKPVVGAELSDDDKKLDSELRKKLCMNGIVLDNVDVIEGMEKEGKSVFIPVGIKDGKIKKSDSIVSLAQMGILMRYVEKLIREMGESLRQGEVCSNPLAVGETNSCQWCPYGSVCGFEDEKKIKVAKGYKTSEIYEKMRGENVNDEQENVDD